MIKKEKTITHSSEQFASDIKWTNLSDLCVFDERIVKKYFHNIPNHWLKILFPFETTKPKQYYDEEIYKQIRTILSSSFDKDMLYCKRTISYFANEFDSIYACFNRLSYIIDVLKRKNDNSEQHYRQFIFPIYMELMEAIWKPLARLCIIAIEKPDELEYQKYSNFNINILENKIKKHEKYELLKGVDRELRNNIAHHKFEFSDNVMKTDMVILHDPVDRDMHYTEIDNLIFGLYDNCSAIIYCILKYISENEVNFDTIPFGHYIKSQILSEAIKSNRISIAENTCSTLNNSLQRNLKITFDYPCDIRVLTFMFYLIKLLVKFIDADKYFIAIHSKKDKSYVWLITNRDRALLFLENKLGVSEYLKTGDIQIFKRLKEYTKTPKYPRAFRILPDIFRNTCITIKREFTHIKGWYIVNEYDFSTGISGRFEIDIVLRRELTKNEINNVIFKTLNNKRAVFKRFFIALWFIIMSIFVKRIKVQPIINVVLIKIWKKEKRDYDTVLDPKYANPLCICCAEWNRDKSFKWLDSRSNDEYIKKIQIRWFNIDNKAT